MSVKSTKHNTTVSWPFSAALAIALPVSLFDYHGLTLLAILLGVFAFIIEIKRGFYIEDVKIQPLYLYLALILIGGLSLIWSYNFDVSLERLLHLLGNFVIGWVVVGTAYRQTQYKLNIKYSAIIYLLGLLSTLALIFFQTASNYFNIDYFEIFQQTTKYNTFLSVTNPTATVLAVFAMPGCLLIWRGIGAPVAIAVLLVTAIIIFLSQSLAAILGFTFSFLLTLAALSAGKKIIRFVTLGIMIFVLALPTISFLNNAPFTYMREQLSSLNVNLPLSSIHRTYIYDFVIQNISNKPILGWGIGVSRSLPGSQEQITELKRELLPLHPHNSIFEIWVELGFVGALAFAILIYFIMMRILRIIKERAATAVLFGAASAYIVIGLTSYSIWSSWWIATAILSAGIWTSLLAERKTPPIMK